uniref:Glyco_18 domain-containing protein n=1 Tax=Rhabditophanes sp. KR3021 TaxID=114890 RepID=A0AC35U346_9BILA
MIRQIALVTLSAILIYYYQSEITSLFDKIPANESKGLLSLGYVTPWNSKGYDIAKEKSSKFSHIVPVWLQIVGNKEHVCEIQGYHDIDHKWIEDVKKGNSKIKIVPRFIVEKWDKKDWSLLLKSDKLQRICGAEIVDFSIRNKFDGITLEIFLQSLMIMQENVVEETINVIEMWSSILKAKDLQIILPLTPVIYGEENRSGKKANLKSSNYYSQGQFARMAKAVDYVNLMTYDFNVQMSMAPIYWISENVEYLIGKKNAELSPKLILGMNFYGTFYSQSEVKPILGHDFEKYMTDKSFKNEWNDIAKEDNWISRENNQMIYFPSEKSIKIRLDYAASKGFGTGIWDLGQGLDYFADLL